MNLPGQGGGVWDVEAALGNPNLPLTMLRRVVAICGGGSLSAAPYGKGAVPMFVAAGADAFTSLAERLYPWLEGQEIFVCLRAGAAAALVTVQRVDSQPWVDPNTLRAALKADVRLPDGRSSTILLVDGSWIPKPADLRIFSPLGNLDAACVAAGMPPLFDNLGTHIFDASFLPTLIDSQTQARGGMTAGALTTQAFEARYERDSAAGHPLNGMRGHYSLASFLLDALLSGRDTGWSRYLGIAVPPGAGWEMARRGALDVGLAGELLQTAAAHGCRIICVDIKGSGRWMAMLNLAAIGLFRPVQEMMLTRYAAAKGLCAANEPALREQEVRFDWSRATKLPGFTYSFLILSLMLHIKVFISGIDVFQHLGLAEVMPANGHLVGEGVSLRSDKAVLELAVVVFSRAELEGEEGGRAFAPDPLSFTEDLLQISNMLAAAEAAAAASGNAPVYKLDVGMVKLRSLARANRDLCGPRFEHEGDGPGDERLAFERPSRLFDEYLLAQAPHMEGHKPTLELIHAASMHFYAELKTAQAQLASDLAATGKRMRFWSDEGELTTSELRRLAAQLAKEAHWFNCGKAPAGPGSTAAAMPLFDANKKLPTFVEGGDDEVSAMEASPFHAAAVERVSVLDSADNILHEYSTGIVRKYEAALAAPGGAAAVAPVPGLTQAELEWVPLYRDWAQGDGGRPPPLPPPPPRINSILSGVRDVWWALGFRCKTYYFIKRITGGGGSRRWDVDWRHG